MKRKFKRLGKSSLSVLLSIMMLISAMMIGQIGSIEANAWDYQSAPYYIAGVGISTYNLNSPCSWTAGLTDFELTSFESGKYRALVHIENGATFKLTSSNNTWYNPQYNLTNVSSTFELVSDGNNGNNLSFKGSTGDYWLCFEPSGYSNQGAIWVTAVDTPVYHIGGRLKCNINGTDYQTGSNWGADDNNKFVFTETSTTGTYKFDTGLSPATLTTPIEGSLPNYFYIFDKTNSFYYQTTTTPLGSGDIGTKYSLSLYQGSYYNTNNPFFCLNDTVTNTGNVVFYFKPSTQEFWYDVEGLTTYNITCNSPANAHGSVASSVASTTDGTTVTVTATPTDDDPNNPPAGQDSALQYKCDGITITKTSDGTDVTSSVTLVHTDINTYTFVMPAYDVTVNGMFTTTHYYTATPKTNGHGTAQVKIARNAQSDFGTNHKSFKGFCEPVIFKAVDEDDYVFNNSWTVSVPNGTYYKVENGELVVGNGTETAREFTIYPTASVTATAMFAESTGTAWDTHNIIHGTTDTFSGTAAQVYYKTSSNSHAVDGKIYYADVDVSNTTQLFFGLSSSTSKDNLYHQTEYNNGTEIEGRKASDKKNNYVVTLEGIASNQWEKKDYGNFSFVLIKSLSNVNKVRIYCETTDNNGTEPKGYKFHVVVTETKTGTGTNTNTSNNVTLYAKHGTTRNEGEERNDKTYSEYIAEDTVVTATSGISGSSLVFDDKVKMYTVTKGTTVTITTTIKNTYKNKAYVKAFCINGYSYGIIDEPKYGDTNRSTGTYTVEYTIPEDTTYSYFEVTPIFFWFTDSMSDNGNNEYITFYAENFEGDVKKAWGDTLSCYAWYTQGNHDDTTQGQRPALGGYPGQPMVYENGSYYMQVPKYWYYTEGTRYSNGDTGAHTVQGITMNNYYWDDVHFFYGNRGNSDKNCQTYDYDDFTAIMAYDDLDDIIFNFKYRTTRDNGGNWGKTSANFTDDLATDKSKAWLYDTIGNCHSDANSPSGNDWNPLVDYYDVSVDIFGNNISDGNGGYLKESDIYTKIGDNKTQYKADSASDLDNNFVYIVSDGYSTDEFAYIGYYATKWYFFLEDGTYLGALPSSALVFDAHSIYGNNDIPADAAAPAAFLGYSDKATNYTNRTQLWETYKSLYNNANVRNVPAVITYEKAIDDEGTKGDYGLRNDGRWYFSRRGATVNANIKIQIIDAEGNITEDPFISGTNQGTTTKAHAYFTNAEFNQATTSGDVPQSETAYFTFRADELSQADSDPQTGVVTYYMFDGWYLSTGADGEYSSINVGDDIDNPEGRRAMVSNATFIARYYKVEVADVNINMPEKTLIITHKPLSDATAGTKPTVHNGTGSTEVSSVTITYSDNSTNTITNSSTSLIVTPADLANASSIAVTIKTTPADASTKVFDVYNMNSSNVYTKSKENTANTWTGEYEKTCSETASVTLPSDSAVTMTYTYNFTDFFTNDSSNETKYLNFFGDFTSTSITVYVKYYDRKIVNNSPTTINEEPTIARFETDVKSATLATAIARDIINKDINKYINNVIDEYVIWDSQTDAKAGIKRLPNLKNAPVDASTPGAVVHGNGSYYLDYEHSTFSGTADFTKHTNCYGDPSGTKVYETNENWITYFDASGNVINNFFENTVEPTDVASVTIWAYNTPKLYTITPVGPTAAGKLTNKATVNGETVYYLTDGSNDNKFTGYQQRGFYNQRLGKKAEGTGSGNADDTVSYLTNYGGIGGYLGTNITAEVNASGIDTSVLNSESEIGSLVFDGWYAAEEIGEDNNKVLTPIYKITSDRTYGYRITTDLTIVACYKNVATGNTLNQNVGLSLTDNGTDYYAVNGVNKVRMNTQFNIYGLDDDNKLGETANYVDKLAMVYVQLPAVYTTTTGGVTTTHYFKGTDADEIEVINAVANRVKTDIQAGTLFSDTGMHTSFITLTSLNITFDSTTNMSDPKYIEYTYDVNSAGGSYKVALTNKNRIQFVLNAKAADYEPGGKYSAILAFGGMFCDTDNDGAVDVGEWIAADNYVSYINNTADPAANQS